MLNAFCSVHLWSPQLVSTLSYTDRYSNSPCLPLCGYLLMLLSQQASSIDLKIQVTFANTGFLGEEVTKRPDLRP